jgi:hypothetical protein
MNGFILKAPKEWTACVSLCRGGNDIGMVGGVRELVYQSTYLAPVDILKYKNRVAEFNDN